jgi:hypothetical protein
MRSEYSSIGDGDTTPPPSFSPRASSSSSNPTWSSIKHVDDGDEYHVQNAYHESMRQTLRSWWAGDKEDNSNNGPIAKTSRFVDRDGEFGQSLGRMNVRKRIRKGDWRALYAADLFHSLVDANTSKCLFVLLASYMLLVLGFSFLYYYVSVEWDCNLGTSNYIESFFFSLETMATIGYGTQDIYFDDCTVVAVLLSFQFCVKCIADAVTIGVIYCRLSRPTKRASTVIFSDQAVIRRIHGKLYFMFQLCELRKHQLAEAHVRLYSIRRDREERSGEVKHFRTISMRLNHPDDELGGMLLLCLPQMIVHQINPFSPLMAPARWRSEKGTHTWDPPGVGKEIERHEDYDLDPSPRGWEDNSKFKGLYSPDKTPSPSSATPSPRERKESDPLKRHSEEKEVLSAFMLDRRVEIVAIVEGTDATTGGTVQARHSYTSDDIVWDHTFVSCVGEDADGSALIDFSVFHDIVECEPDMSSLW